MASEHERFWDHDRFAVIGDSAKRDYPTLTYQGLKKMGKEVIAVDLGGESVDGDVAVRNIEDIPASIEAAVLELPKEATGEAVTKLASLGVRDIWIHQGTESPMALAAAQSNDVSVVTGNCAVMYVNCTSHHKIHRWIWRLLGKY